ncbi:hypothetical protein AALO_G00151500 [Alosa alosa]|uniref:EF-hand domain-containing protein n=3 Tax=Alosa TaxID=34772 RepID=A0AAV6GJD8_9TELE|nr:hypothetical protein AALO_G00151500 [Alosa alosa]
MLTEGSSVEKLRWSFKLYDKDKDGTITRGEMLEIMQAVYKMSVAASITKINPLTAEECTNRIFVRLDKDNNAIISLEEFIEGALGDEWIREMLECDPNTVKVERPPKRSLHDEHATGVMDVLHLPSASPENNPNPRLL